MRNAAVRLPGTVLKRADPDTTYAGMLATTTPGNRPKAVCPWSVWTIASNAAERCPSSGIRVPSIQGEPVRAMCQEVQSAPKTSVVHSVREMVRAYAANESTNTAPGSIQRGLRGSPDRAGGGLTMRSL